MEVIQSHVVARVYLVVCMFIYYTVNKLYLSDTSEVIGGERGIFHSPDQSLALYIYLWSYVSAP